jgi:hypothetical protein
VTRRRLSGLEFVRLNRTTPSGYVLCEVNISKLRNHLPEYLSRAESGEEILITRLIPAQDTLPGFCATFGSD